MITVKGLYYSKDHEWVKVDGNKALIGITDYAQHALGEIVYVELPELGTEYEAGDVFCVIESVRPLRIPTPRFPEGWKSTKSWKIPSF